MAYNDGEAEIGAVHGSCWAIEEEFVFIVGAEQLVNALFQKLLLSESVPVLELARL